MLSNRKISLQSHRTKLLEKREVTINALFFFLILLDIATVKIVLKKQTPIKLIAVEILVNTSLKCD